MRFWKKYGKGFLALILAVVMVGGMASVPEVFAEENNTQLTTDIIGDEEINEDAEFSSSENENDENMEKESVAYTDNSAQVESDETTEQVFNLSVTFDGKELSTDTSQNMDFLWTNTNAKTMKVTLERNGNVSADSNKNYIVCMKVPQAFYFSGLPDASKINGVEEVTIVKNSCPQVNTSAGKTENISGFSPYSGEIRLRLNPSVQRIEITDIGIKYKEELIGYTGGSQSVENPVSVSLVSVEHTKNLEEFEDSEKNVLDIRQVGAVSIKTESISGTGIRTAISLDAFKTAGVNESDVNLGKGSKVSFSKSTQGQKWQVYKKLVVVFHCPYITYDDGEQYYLDFDLNDSVFANNATEGGKTAYKMSGAAVYDAAKHTITYSFENIYLGGYTALYYTPQFSWPEALKNETIATGKNYLIEGGDWEITEQEGFTGVTSSLKQYDKPLRVAYYIPDQVNVTLTSSDQADASQKIATRRIYKGITRENGVPGTLGFFDVHNDGALDSPLVNITFDFNTDSTDEATYYVTGVNLPVYENKNGVDVKYTLTDGDNEKEGTIHYTNTTSFTCEVDKLRANSGADSDYYIKSLSYRTILQRGTAYHIETAHLNRNRMQDSGLFFGYLEGELETAAHAKMSISAVDEEEKINIDNDNSISSTEKSMVWDEDFIACSLSAITVNGNDISASITAGDSMKLKFGASVSTEEYHTGKGYVNGYHVFRDGIFYLCLPDGVSIPGTEQITVNANGTKLPVTSMTHLENTTCTINGVNASWWEIQVDGINVTGGKAVTVEVQLATSLAMDGLSWDFKNSIVVRTKGQYVSWGAADSKNTVYNTTDAMDKNTGSPSIIALSSYLKNKNDTENLGLCAYNGTTNTNLTIARAEAKLDVQTGIEVGSSTVDQAAVSVSNADTQLAYNVLVSSKDGGHADKFEYYIPIVSRESAIDANTLVAQNEFGLKLQEAANITKMNDSVTDEAETVSSEIPFTVYYTTNSNLTSANIRTDQIKWQTADEFDNDFSNVTAVKIVTDDGAMINNGESFDFKLQLKYDNSNSDFEHMAGSIVEWRSFGYYSYTRNNTTEPTTNSYPSELNHITIAYIKNLADHPMVAQLNTGETNDVHTSLGLENTFEKKQIFVVKKVQPSSGMQLIADNPKNLTGTKANTQFQVTFNINSGIDTAALLTERGTAAGKEWVVDANTVITLQGEVKFSQALTDTVTDRYIDVTIGNENVDITFRIRLDRTVKPATADGSGVINGANYQVPNVVDSCEIGQKSAFTALYVLEFTPGKYKNQVITWKNDGGTDIVFPMDTNITMMEIGTVGDVSTVNSFWYYRTTGSEKSIDLTSFQRMSGSELYSYDTSTTTSQKVIYMFVVDFSQAKAAQGTYQFAWEADPKDEIVNNTEKLSYKYLVELQSEKTYALSSNETAGLIPHTAISYTIGEATNDSYIAHRSLALVFQPIGDLPKDAKLQCGEKIYKRNSAGNYIVPIENFASGTKEFSLISDMFPDNEMTYSFKAQLYLAESVDNDSPMNGSAEGDEITVNFKKTVQNRPALCITGKRIGTAADWGKGQTINIQLKNIEDGQLTVTAYFGLTGTQKATDLLSSVSGKFDIEGGVGTYKKANANTSSLILNGNAQPGTYRLVFDVKNTDGDSVMQVPYYIIVK